MTVRARLVCVYCGGTATTKDHVVPRCLLEKPYPPNLPTVPSCRRCNEGFSPDEEYFLAVMAQASCVGSMLDKVKEGGVVDRMLARGAGLDAHFTDCMSVDEDGRVFLQPDEQRLANVARKVAFGLYLHRYRPRRQPDIGAFLSLRPSHDLDSRNYLQVMAVNERFQPRRWEHMQTHVMPDGAKVQVLDYMFVRNWVWGDFGKLFCIMRFHETIWSAVRCPYPSPSKNRRPRIGTSVGGVQRNLPF